MTTADPTADRSVPRRLLIQGRTERDGRGRYLGAPAILQYGFRPFFLLAALHAALALPFWLWMYVAGIEVGGPFAGVQWHAHEMLFGYLGAVIAGFVLTAVPNWTGRLPLSGAPLAVLVSLWLVGRVACAAVSDPLAAALLDLAFPIALAAAILREIIVGKNWRNGPVGFILVLFASANLLHHLEAAAIVEPGIAIRLALGTIGLLIALIGGRITPSFTRNWLAKRGETRMPASFGSLDRSALALTALVVPLWVLWPERSLTGLLFIVAGMLLLARLSRWRGHRTCREPILFVLHLGYGWLAISLTMLGASVLFPATIMQASANHALTAGAIATMTLAVMTRASLGHTGREIRADGWTIALYLAVTAGALLRVVSPYLGEAYQTVLIGAGTLWSLAFAIFVLRYGPILASPRR